MNTTEINAKLSHLKCYVGAFPRDILPRKLRKGKNAMVINTDPSHLPGQHWVALIIQDGAGEYFDSFGMPPLHDDITSYISKQCPKGCCYNPMHLQSVTSSTCGLYTIAYIVWRCTQNDFNSFIKLFTTSNTENDKRMRLL